VINISGSVPCLSLRKNEIPGLKPETVLYLNKITTDKAVGIRYDKKIFLANVPTDPLTLTKVLLYCDTPCI